MDHTDIKFRQREKGKVRRVSLIAAAFVIVAMGMVPVSAIAQNDRKPASRFIVEQYRNKALSGDSRAQFRLGLLHERGLVSGTPDLTLARYWYGKAADANYPLAQFKSATFLANGLGGPSDLVRAAALYRSAAEQDVGEAQFNLAILLQEGRGVAQDKVEAIQWFEQASVRGVIPAMRALGLIYLAEVETSQEGAIEAWAWLTLADENGDPLAATYRVDAGALLTSDARIEALKRVDAYRQLRLNP